VDPGPKLLAQAEQRPSIQKIEEEELQKKRTPDPVKERIDPLAQCLALFRRLTGKKKDDEGTLKAIAEFPEAIVEGARAIRLKEFDAGNLGITVEELDRRREEEKAERERLKAAERAKEEEIRRELESKPIPVARRKKGNREGTGSGLQRVFNFRQSRGTN
jgi:hypothetical protein